MDHYPQAFGKMGWKKLNVSTSPKQGTIIEEANEACDIWDQGTTMAVSWCSVTIKMFIIFSCLLLFSKTMLDDLKGRIQICVNLPRCSLIDEMCVS